MDYVIIEESRTSKVKTFEIITMIVYAVLSLMIVHLSLKTSVFVFGVGLCFVGYSEAYKISKDFNNYRLFLFFGKTIWKSKLDIEFPDYISVFHASFVHRDEVDGTEDILKKWVVRFFKDNRYFTVLEDDTYDIVLESANRLSELLNVEVYDTTKI